MKANAPKRKVFNDAVDLLMDDMTAVSGFFRWEPAG